jgi:hypothetical protein
MDRMLEMLIVGMAAGLAAPSGVDRLTRERPGTTLEDRLPPPDSHLVTAVSRDGIEPPTRGFSILCSTD